MSSKPQPAPAKPKPRNRKAQVPHPRAPFALGWDSTVPTPPRKNTKRTGEFSEVEALCGRERSGSPQPKSRAQRGTSTSTRPPRKNTKRTGEFSEVEALCGRERSGSPQPKSRAQRGTSTSTQLPRKNTKRTGEFSEAAFLTKATSLGFKVAKPWGDSERYDFIVACAAEPPEFFYRVQVKCTETVRARAYEVRAAYSLGKGRAIYTPNDIDFLVAHIVPRDLWYVVPVDACMPSPMLRFYPDGARHPRFEHYREAWDLLRQRPGPT